jgi:hypothetical protein
VIVVAPEFPLVGLLDDDEDNIVGVSTLIFVGLLDVGVVTIMGFSTLLMVVGLLDVGAATIMGLSTLILVGLLDIVVGTINGLFEEGGVSVGIKVGEIYPFNMRQLGGEIGIQVLDDCEQV